MSVLEATVCLYCGADGPVVSRAWVCKPCRAAEVESGKKLCRRCRLVKAASEFYDGKACADGLSSWCKQCATDASTESAAAVRQAVAKLSRRAAGIAEPKPGQCRAFVNLGVSFLGAVHCGRAASAGGYCLTHASAEVRAISQRLAAYNKGQVRFGEGRWLDRQRAREEADLKARCETYPELAGLLAEQEKDARINQIGKPWMLSLDVPRWDDGESGVDFVTHDAQGHAVYLQRRSHEADAPWVDPLIDAIDRQREIDAWAEAVAA